MNPSALLLSATWIAVLLVVAPVVAAADYWLRIPRSNTPDERVLVIAPLVWLGLGAYLAFFAFLVNPVVGKTFSFLLPLASGAYLVVARRRHGAPPQTNNIAVPARLAICIGLFYLALLYLPKLGQAYADQSAFRFIHPLPFDPVIPAMAGDRLYAGESLRPFVLDWLSSDRPPLQTGLYLLVLPWLKLAGLPEGLGYQCVATLAQVSWVMAVWLMARALGKSLLGAMMVVLTTAAVGFFVLNSTFAWPKLLAGAYASFAGVLLLASSKAESKPLTLCACCAALAWLSHGSVAFSLVTLMLVWCVQGCPGWKRTPQAAAVFLLLILPWIWYQKVYDPPGDRLLKWHLAGVVNPDQRGFIAALRDAYSTVSLREWWAVKRANFSLLLNGSFKDIADFVTTISKHRRTEEFFFFFRAVGLLNLAWIAWPIVWCLRRRSLENATLFWTMSLWLLATVLFWVAVMFIPGSTVLHHGSSVMMIIACTLAAVLISDLPRACALVLLSWHGAYFVTTWLLYFGAAPVNRGMAALGLLAFVGAAATARGIRRMQQPSAASDNRSISPVI